MKTRKPSRKPRADSPETWPIVWRVAMPAAGSFNYDMTMLETTDEAEARRIWGNLRRVRYPVRLERVSCGPLPKGARKELASFWRGNQQNPGAKMRKVLGYWEGTP